MKWYQKSAVILILLGLSLSIGGMTSCNDSTPSTSSITSSTTKTAVAKASAKSTTETTLQKTITTKPTTVKETTAVASVETKPATTTKETKPATTTKETTAAVTTKESTVATTKAAPIPEPDTFTGDVYVTNTGSKYHRDGCRYLSDSKIAISLADAKQGYEPCKVCDPPQ